jgi:hypothetical protein
MDLTVIVIVVVVTALAFDFTNGFTTPPMRWRRRSPPGR